MDFPVYWLVLATNAIALANYHLIVELVWLAIQYCSLFLISCVLIAYIAHLVRLLKKHNLFIAISDAIRVIIHRPSYAIQINTWAYGRIINHGSKPRTTEVQDASVVENFSRGFIDNTSIS